VSELVGLVVDQVDLEEAVLRDLRRKGGHRQMLPLNREVLQELNLWLPVRGRREVATDCLFIGRTGRGIGVRQVQRQLKESGQKAGCVFRRKWPLVPIESGRLFRSNVAAHSD